ncbi:MAG: C39 family peptidase [Pseudomonadales bacterium]
MAAIASLRYADPDTSRRYPLEVRGEADWRPHDGAWTVTLPLPDLLPGTILVPSLALPPGGSQSHVWRLEADGAAWALQEVPAAVAAQPSPRPPPSGAVSTHIDCYHVHRRLAAPRLQLQVRAAQRPHRYLLCASSRPLTLAAPPLPPRLEALPEKPAARSQTLAPAAIAGRICSPTCVSMVLDLWGKNHDWLTLVAECLDPASGLYGVWPLALQAAAARDCLGAVEVFDSWQEPLRVLGSGVPLVTSIRFSAGALPGAPLPETNGHLVVVHGAGPGRVQVCDPAAGPDGVDRSYDARAFSEAWLRHRGAAYILPR